MDPLVSLGAMSAECVLIQLWLMRKSSDQDAGEWRLSRLLVEYAKVLDVLNSPFPEASNI